MLLTDSGEIGYSNHMAVKIIYNLKYKVLKIHTFENLFRRTLIKKSSCEHGKDLGSQDIAVFTEFEW